MFRTKLLYLLPIFLCCISEFLNAQTCDVQISVASLSPPRITIEGKRATATNNWSFLKTYAGADALSERIENLSFMNTKGESATIRKLAPGEYETAGEATAFRYEVKLEPPLASNHAAHVSWLTSERGALMLNDLLPMGISRAKVNIALPPKWSATTSETKAGAQYDVTNVENAIFIIGEKLRERRMRVRGMDVAFVIAGEWAFADDEIAALMRDVLKEHESIVGVMPRNRTLIAFGPFPRPAGVNQWSAEVRAGTVMFLSGRASSKTSALAQLYFPLAHELFHLWIPNSLALDGDYAWFYEGFTLYQALRVGVRLDHLSFQDYLNAIARAFDGYKLAASKTGELSLLEASQRRWTADANLPYNKGMLTAFLYDLTLRQQTKSNQSLDNIYRQLFRPNLAQNDKRAANDLIIKLLTESLGTTEFTKRYIESNAEINLAEALFPFGLRAERAGNHTRIFVNDSLTGQQRDLLRKLGYND